MKRILLTGMSSSGKSTLVAELASRGYKAVDLDCDRYSEWVAVEKDTDVVGSYGRRPDEAARVLGLIESVEPLLRRIADRVIDTNVPLGDVVAVLLSLVA